MRRALIPLLFVLVGAPAAFPSEPAADDALAQPAPVPRTPLDRLGRPARPEAVRSELLATRQSEPGEQVRLAQALGTAGGPAALDGLVDLIERGDATVRAAAFRAAQHVGLRHAGLRSAARWALGRRGAPDRRHAVRALGVAGDGRDVPDLLHIAADEAETPAARLAAFDALRRISGHRKPFKLERWRTWWQALERDGVERVEDAIKTFENDPTRRQVAADILTRMAWLRLDEVGKRVTGWLRDEDPLVRLAAARIAAATRFAPLAKPMAEAWEAAEGNEQVRGALKPGLHLLGGEIYLTPENPPVTAQGGG